MPKPMRVMVEIEEIAFGRVFRALDGMQGVVTITPMGDGPRAAQASNGTRGKNGGAGNTACLVLGALLKTPGLSRAQLNPILVANGRREASLPSTLTELFKAGQIKRTGKGKNVVYTATTKGKKRFDTACQIQPPKEGE